MNTEVLRPILARYIREEDSLALAFSEPTTDLFTLGLDSMGAFALLDDLAGAGYELEFTELVSEPTVEFIVSQAAQA